MAFVDSLSRQRKRLVTEFSEDWLSCACKWVLISIPLLFVIGHVLSFDAQANFHTGWKFRLFDFSISLYPWRSPGGWAVLASMTGFAFVLGFISWFAAKYGRGFYSWFTSIVAAMAMVNLLQAACFPYAPSQNAFWTISEEIRNESRPKASEEIWATAMEFDKYPNLRRLQSTQYLDSLRSHWLHDLAFFQFKLLTALTMFGTLCLWEQRVPNPRRWNRFHELVFILTIMALVGGMFAGYDGLFQRVLLVVWYGWLWLVFREIDRQRNREAEEHSDHHLSTGPESSVPSV